jgi:hypothetical protein
MFLWWSGYVKRQCDEFQHSSAFCQARMGACGYVLPCQALNAPASSDPGSGSGYPVVKAPG